MVDRFTHQSERDNADRRHEPDWVWTGSIVSIGVGVVLLVIFAMIGVATVFRDLIPQRSLVDSGVEWNRQHNLPGVQPNQAYDRQRLLMEEEAYLNQYGWQDKDRGIARIPIERSIEIMAQQNLQVEWPTDGSQVPAEKEAP